MFIDPEKKLITYPMPQIEPASDELRETMDFVLANRTSSKYNFFYESVAHDQFLTSYRGLDWHVDDFEEGKYKIEIAATSTPTTVASAVIDFSNVDKGIEQRLLTIPIDIVVSQQGSRWVEAARDSGELVSKSGLIVRDVTIIQLEPYQVASGDIATLLHRSTEINPGDTRTRVLYRRTLPMALKKSFNLGILHKESN